MALSQHPYTIHELLRDLKSGSAEAFAALFDRYHARVMHTAFIIVKQKEMSEDIVQDIFMKCWSRRTELEDLGDFEGWLFVITRNHALNTLRRMISVQAKNSMVAEKEPQWVEDADWRANMRSYESQIRAATAQLTQQQRRVFELSHFEGMNRAEIAATLGLSPNTTKMHLVRALRIVRAQLAQHIDKAVLVVLFQKLF